MKVLLISLFVPSEHNIKGPTSLPYYLAKEKPVGIEIDLMCYDSSGEYEFNNNDKLNEIFSNIFILERYSKVYRYLGKFLQRLNIIPSLKGVDMAYLPNEKDLRIINENEYDIIWIYPNILYAWYRRLSNLKIVMTGPDCSLLHYRLIKKYSEIDPTLFPKTIRQVNAYKKLSVRSINLETLWANSNALIHVVGEEDKNVYDQLSTKEHCFFTLHPHSSYEQIEKRMDETNGKLTILISATNNSIYTGVFLDKIIGTLINSTSLQAKYRFMIIGEGFEGRIKELENVGYEIEHYTWVENYPGKIKKAHIQIFPIVLGTGTKGKVLCAFATGLLCIGTKHAFENIRVEYNMDCLLIKNEQEIIDALNDIYANRSEYTLMSERGMNKIRQLHSPALTSKLFWECVRENFKFN